MLANTDLSVMATHATCSTSLILPVSVMSEIWEMCLPFMLIYGVLCPGQSVMSVLWCQSDVSQSVMSVISKFGHCFNMQLSPQCGDDTVL